MSTIWMGGKHDDRPLCCAACAEAWSSDNYDCDWDQDGFFQCNGFIEEGYESEPGDVCAWCKKEIPV